MSRSKFFSLREREVKAPTYLVIHDTDVAADVQADLVSKGHEARGYNEGFYGNNICYHFLIGKDGTIKQNRALWERTGCTRNQEVNVSAISIVLAGELDKEPPTDAEMKSLKRLTERLDSIYHFEHIILHRDASPTACPGKFAVEAIQTLGILRNEDIGTIYSISRYYSPVEGQTKYYRDTYLQDVKVNCGLNADGTASDCFHTADGFNLHGAAPMSVAACPPEIPLGSKIHIEGIGDLICHDHGGAIKNKRIDVWAGEGITGLRNILDPKNKSGYLNVSFK